MRVKRCRPTIRLGAEDGVALVLAIVIVAALTISSAALVRLATANQRAFTRDALQTRAFHVAEAGLNVGIGTLRSTDPAGAVVQGSAVGSEASPVACCEGLGGWWAEKLTPVVWKVWAQGLSPSGEVLRRVATEVTVDATSVNAQPSLAWSYDFFAAAPEGCTTMTGSTTVTASVFVRGDLCLDGTNRIAEPSLSGPQVVEIYVEGTLYLTGVAQIGSSSRPVRHATIPGGCVRNGQTRPCHQASQSRVYASLVDGYGSQQSTLEKPSVNADAVYGSGDWDNPVCDDHEGYAPFVFDNDGSRNSSVGTISLLGGDRYDCVIPGSGGGTVGRLSWDPGSGTLRVEGTVFLDGNLSIDSGDQARYAEGTSATLYVNGVATTNGDAALCGPPSSASGASCPGQWDADDGALGVVVLNAGGSETGWSMSGNVELDLLVYVVGRFAQTGTARVTGPVVADSIILVGSAGATSVTNPPAGLPGAGASVVDTNWRVVPGSWQQLPIA